MWLFLWQSKVIPCGQVKAVLGSVRYPGRLVVWGTGVTPFACAISRQLLLPILTVSLFLFSEQTHSIQEGISSPFSSSASDQQLQRKWCSCGAGWPGPICRQVHIYYMLLLYWGGRCSLELQETPKSKCLSRGTWRRGIAVSMMPVNCCLFKSCLNMRLKSSSGIEARAGGREDRKPSAYTAGKRFLLSGSHRKWVHLGTAWWVERLKW